MADLFIEIYCEEIPATMQKQAIADFESAFKKGLIHYGFITEQDWDCRSAISARHIALEIKGLRPQIAGGEEKKRGPRIGAPDKAIDGFCQSAGISRDQLVIENTPRGEFYFARIRKEDMSLHQSAVKAVQFQLDHFPWPKSMRWADKKITWIRPIKAINLLIDGKPVKVNIFFNNKIQIEFSSTSYGHPFHASKPISLSNFDKYCEDMKKAFVIIDHKKRKQMIEAQCKAVADENELQLIADEALLDEVNGLVEWPNVIMGKIDNRFMALPPEVLIASMRKHQKFFALSKTGKADNLAPHFLTVANRIASEEGDTLIRTGNERVLSARLSDAEFFWQQDQKISLADMQARLNSIDFYKNQDPMKNLGSMKDKTERMEKLAKAIADQLQMSDSDKKLACRAASLAKLDLTSGMVAEFPELQGIMGSYYVREAGIDDKIAIAEAIGEHYRPHGKSDNIPQTRIGQIVAIADKLDTLIGFLSTGKKPTGSGDPFALRRAALGIIRISMEAKLRLNLYQLFAVSIQSYGIDDKDDKLKTDFEHFIMDRFYVILSDRGYPRDVIYATIDEAIFPFAKTDGKAFLSIIFHFDRLKLLSDFLSTEEGKALLRSYHRIDSILVKNHDYKNELIDQEYLTESTENKLFKTLTKVNKNIANASNSYKKQLKALATLSQLITAFFDTVMINDTDEKKRQNRLALLQDVKATMEKVADFSQLSGEYRKSIDK